MELDRHIEILLLDNDCVIVPGLGGFIAYHTDACYDAATSSFIPPTRTAGFNPKLSMNDNLLAQSYVEAYDISYPEAVTRINRDSEELKKELEKNGSYEINGVGCLKVNDLGKYEFTPFEAGLLTPQYYGLNCFEASLLSDVSSSDAVNDEAAVASENADSHKFVRIRISTIRKVAAAAIAIFAFFLLSAPLGRSDKNMASVASIQNGVLYKILPMAEPASETNSSISDNMAASASRKVSAEKVSAKNSAAVMQDKEKSLTVKVTDSNEKKMAQAATAEKSKTATAAKAPAVKKPAEYYCIVLASALSKTNAENYVKKLNGEGLKGIHSIDCSNGMKVVCGNFESNSDARASLDNMRSNENFKDAWIYKVKDRSK